MEDISNHIMSIIFILEICAVLLMHVPLQVIHCSAAQTDMDGRMDRQTDE